MDNSISKKDTHNDMYKYIYIATINKVIDEPKYYKLLQQLRSQGFKTYRVNNFLDLAENLKTVGLNNSFNISILVFVRDSMYKRLSNITTLFDLTDKTENDRPRPKKIHEIVVAFRQMLNLIRSFIKINTIIPSKSIFHKNLNNESNSNLDSNLDSEPDLIPDFNQELNNSKKTKSLESTIFSSQTEPIDLVKLDKEFYSQFKTDVINRLYFLTQHFTLDQLKFMNVKLKYLSEIEKMDYFELKHYYLLTILTLKKTLDEWIKMCRNYSYVEYSYKEYCEGVNKGIMIPTLPDKIYELSKQINKS